MIGFGSDKNNDKQDHNIKFAFHLFSVLGGEQRHIRRKWWRDGGTKSKSVKTVVLLWKLEWKGGCNISKRSSPREKHISWFFNPNLFYGIDWEACYHPQPIHPALLLHPQLNTDSERNFRCLHRFLTFSLVRVFVQFPIVACRPYTIKLPSLMKQENGSKSPKHHLLSGGFFPSSTPFFLVSCLLSFLLCFFSSWGTTSPLEASFPHHSPLTCKSLRKCKILRFGISINACPNQWENIRTSRLS